ncbi:MAG: FAD-binding protein [Phycisphaerales bacterium]|nr:MAG: FAD-binding protein [Phycisphaerales bacterium]
MYDVTIIGAGPAGSTLARLIGRHCRVLLVDKRPLDGDATDAASSKCCGGLLAPDAQAMLSKMGLGLPKSVLVDPQLFVVRAIDSRRNLERYYQRYYINMDRLKFDRWLLSMVPPDVERGLGWRFRSCQRSGEAITMRLTRRGQIRRVQTRILVGADGASSRVRKLALADRPSPNVYIAIQHWVEANRQLPYFSTLFDPRITDYYCWTIPKQEHLIIGAALRPRDRVREKFEMLRQSLADWGIEFGKTVRREAAMLLRPTRPWNVSTGEPQISLIGEAAGFISPSSAEGLSYAFKSAVIAADILRKSPDDFHRRMRARTRRLRANLLLKNIKSHFIYDSRLRGAIMRSGLAGMHLLKS